MSGECKSFIHFPLAFIFMMGIGFLICYGIGLSLDHIKKLPLWPFVSDTGATPPESSIFTLILTCSAFLMFITMFLYYKYVIHCDSQSNCNIASAIVCFGITMVGAFQTIGTTFIPHAIRALLAFVGAQVYSWIVIYISWRQLLGRAHDKTIVYVRIFLAIIELISFVVLIVGEVLSQANPSYYNLATVSEWVLIYTALIFVATLAHDLKKVRGAKIELQFDSEASSPIGRQTLTTYQPTSTVGPEP